MDRWGLEQLLFTIGMFVVCFFVTLIILGGRITWHHYPVDAEERKIVLEHQSNCKEEQ